MAPEPARRGAAPGPPSGRSVRRLRDAWAVLRGRKRAAHRVPVTPAMLNQSVVMWRYTVDNESLANLHNPEPLARVIARQAERDVYVKVCEMVLNHAVEKERRA